MPESKENREPKLKGIVSKTDPKLQFGISADGGVLVYGIRRWPIFFYASELERFWGLKNELMEFIVEHADDLSLERPDRNGKSGKPEQMTTNKADIAVVSAYADKMAAEGNTSESIKYATLKGIAEANQYKVSPQQMFDIMSLKAKLGKL